MAALNAESQIDKVEQICAHSFSDRKLVLHAITHPSAVEGKPVSSSYERLEFLGDSILGAMVATDLFERFDELDEGALTRLKISLVSGKTLSSVAEKLGIGECIVFGDSEKGTGARGLHSALENVYESLVGALYLDGGYEVAHAFVSATLGPHMKPELANQPENPKSELQELTQRRFKCAPVYELVGESGPAHSPTFSTFVYVGGKKYGEGTGSSKKESEVVAAADAISHFKEEK